MTITLQSRELYYWAQTPSKNKEVKIMKKGLQVVGMPVMGIKEGVQCGIAKSFVIDAQTKKISALILKGDKNEFDLRMIRTSDILNIGRDFIMTKTAENVREVVNAGVLILLFGMNCVASSGDVVGKVKDFSFVENTGEILGLEIDSGAEFNGNEIVTISSDFIFLSNEMKSEANGASTGSNGLSSYEREQREFLIGKTVSSNIVDASGKVLIAKGTVISESDIDIAQRAQLLTDLTLSVE